MATPTDLHYTSTHHHYTHWFDIPATDLAATTLTQVDKAPSTSIMPPPRRPAHVGLPAQTVRQWSK